MMSCCLITTTTTTTTTTTIITTLPFLRLHRCRRSLLLPGAPAARGCTGAAAAAG